MHIKLSNDVKALACLQHNVPVLFRIVEKCGTLPHALASLLPGLMEVAHNPYKVQPVQSEPSTEESSLCYFPHLPVVRDRGTFAADSIASMQLCRKSASRHPALLPGTFTIFCPHGELYDVT